MHKHYCLVHFQDKRQQMMNDVRALCDAPQVPGLIDFVGAYHESETGQVCQPLHSNSAMAAALCACFIFLTGSVSSEIFTLQIAIVLEYMDGGSLGDVLQKVS